MIMIICTIDTIWYSKMSTLIWNIKMNTKEWYALCRYNGKYSGHVITFEMRDGRKISIHLLSRCFPTSSLLMMPMVKHHYRFEQEGHGTVSYIELSGKWEEHQSRPSRAITTTAISINRRPMLRGSNLGN